MFECVTTLHHDADGSIYLNVLKKNICLEIQESLTKRVSNKR
jgi:hypothetical protein